MATHTLTVHRHAGTNNWTVTLEDGDGNLIGSTKSGSICLAVKHLAVKIKMREALAEKVAEQRAAKACP